MALHGGQTGLIGGFKVPPSPPDSFSSTPLALLCSVNSRAPPCLLTALHFFCQSTEIFLPTVPGLWNSAQGVCAKMPTETLEL